MAMSYHDAELFYDRGIPRGAVDPNAPDRLRPANRVRLVNVREKPASIVRRMVDALAMLAGSNLATEDALKRFGFTPAQIAEHGTAAVRQMILENPTLPLIEWGA